MTQKDKTWFAIVNPHAGSGKTISEWHKAESLLRKYGIEYVCAETAYAGHAVELARQAASEGYRLFAAVGGDGTAHETFNGILRFYDSCMDASVDLEEFAMAVIPIGSGNDWIKTHEIPRDIEKVLRLMKSESFVKQDVARVSQVDAADPEGVMTAPAKRVDYILNVAGIGFDSRICEIVNRQKQEGKKGSSLYFKALLKVIRDFYSFPVSIFADGEPFYEGDCFSIAFGVGQWSGGGMRQVPDAVVDDGLLDMMIVPKMPIPQVLPKLPHLFTGKLRRYDGLLRFSRSTCYAVLPHPNGEHLPEVIEIDGETIGRIPCRFEVLPRKIRVLSCLGRK